MNTLPRCPWAVEPSEYRRYHDEEWGRPVVDETRIYEKLCLEGFQAGLSWLTVLRKREAFRAAFSSFDVRAVAAFGDDEVARLLADAGIVRHRAKIEAAIANARATLDLQASGASLASLLWSFEPPAAREWYRFALAHPSVSVVLMAPANRKELEEDLTLLDDWRAPDAEEWSQKARKEAFRRGSGALLLTCISHQQWSAALCCGTSFLTRPAMTG